MYVGIYIYICIYIYTHIHIYIYIYIGDDNPGWRIFWDRFHTSVLQYWGILDHPMMKKVSWLGILESTIVHYVMNIVNMYWIYWIIEYNGGDGSSHSMPPKTLISTVGYCYFKCSTKTIVIFPNNNNQYYYYLQSWINYWRWIRGPTLTVNYYYHNQTIKQWSIYYC